MHQLSVWTKSDNPFLDKREFYIGFLNAGTEVELQKDIRLPYGYGAEKGDIEFIFRDEDEKELKIVKDTYKTSANAKPNFEYVVKMFDDGSKMF